MESVIQRHPFVDGNKRTGVACATCLLRERGYRLARVTNALLVELSLNVATYRMSTEQLEAWFEDHAQSA